MLGIFLTVIYLFIGAITYSVLYRTKKHDRLTLIMAGIYWPLTICMGIFMYFAKKLDQFLDWVDDKLDKMGQ